MKKGFRRSVFYPKVMVRTFNYSNNNLLFKSLPLFPIIMISFIYMEVCICVGGCVGE